MSAPLLAMGGLVGGGAAAGATLLGGVLSGVASAWSARSERKAAEKSQIAEENRRSARYEGLGQASRYWENGQGQQQQSQTQAEKVAGAPALGKRPDQVGSKYAVTPNSQLPQPKKPRWRFNPDNGVEKVY